MRQKTRIVVGLFALAVVVPFLSQCSSASSVSKTAATSVKTHAAESVKLKVGDKAPDFTLPDQDGKSISLSQYLGKKNVVLAFYVLAFTGG